MRRTVLVRSQGQDVFQRAEWLEGRESELLDLSPDGRRLLLSTRYGEIALAGLAERQIEPLVGLPDFTVRGTFSPQGDRLALLAIVSVPDRPGEEWRGSSDALVVVRSLGDGRDVELWRSPGGWSAESAVEWSRDGRHLAVTWLFGGDDDNELTTVVLDSAGRELGRQQGVGLRRRPRPVPEDMPFSAYHEWDAPVDLPMTEEVGLTPLFQPADDGVLHWRSGAAHGAIGTVPLTPDDPVSQVLLSQVLPYRVQPPLGDT